LEEQKSALLPSQFARLHLNLWTQAEDRLTSVEDLRACVGHSALLDAQPGRTYAVGLDIGLKKDRTVLSVCHVETVAEGRQQVVLDRQVVWSGTRKQPVDLREVEATALHLHNSYGRPMFVVDPYQAALLIQNLQQYRVRISEYNFNQSSIGRLAQRLYQLLRDRALVLPDDAELLDELANVRIRETSPGLYRMDHDADRHDDRAISLALAANWLLSEAPKRRLLRFEPAPEMAQPIPHQPPKPGLTRSSEVYPGLSDFYDS
jgi:phage FluMu gp28-like protein